MVEGYEADWHGAKVAAMDVGCRCWVKVGMVWWCVKVVGYWAE